MQKVRDCKEREAMDGRRTALSKYPLNLGPGCSPRMEGLCRGECTRTCQCLRAGDGEEEPIQPSVLKLCVAAPKQLEVASQVTPAISHCHLNSPL